MQKVFSFKGITRSGDDLLASEGECLEIINMRMKNGSLVPLPNPKNEVTLDYNYSKIYWHEIAHHYLCVTDDANATLHVYDSLWSRVKDSSGTPLQFEKLKNIQQIEFLGFVACCLTKSGIIYLLYNDGCYRYLGERPQLPVIDVTITSSVKKITTEVEYYTTSNDNFESTWRCNAKGHFDEAISMLNESGHYIDRAMFKFALRIYDGSYICISPAIYVCDDEFKSPVGRDAYNLYAEQTESGTPTTFNVYVLGFKPEFKFAESDLKDWKNIVMGIDVFTTGSIMGKKVKELKWRNRTLDTPAGNVVKYDSYVAKDADELYNDILNASHYYKIAEYDIEGNLVESLDNVSQTNLVLQQALENDKCSYSSLVPGCSYVFNNRLHVGALKEYMFKGHGPTLLNGAQGEKLPMEMLLIKTKVNTLHGVSVVVKKYPNLELVFNKGCYELPPMLSYPDSRAFEMSVYAYVDTELFCKTFPLTPHRYLNQAQYLNRKSVGYKVSCRATLASSATLYPVRDIDILEMFSGKPGVYEIVYSKSNDSWMYNGAPFPTGEFADTRFVKSMSQLADGNKLIFTITECSDESAIKDICNIPIDNTWKLLGGDVDFSDIQPFEQRGNLLKVSSVDNPFIFPAECTYMPSQGEVVALASNTVALSQGQFGQHPLYVFCSDGIWAMSVDASGASAYLSSYPLSREICVNRNSVCGINGGVVFVAQQGVMLLSGGKIKKISEAVEGNTGFQKQILDNPTISNIVSMMQLTDYVGNESFVDFVGSARVAYLSSHDEIIFSNSKFKYCYVFSMQYGTWSRMGATVTDFIKCHSFFKMFANMPGGSRILNIGTAIAGDNNVLIVTRPQLWGTKLPKRILQMMLHSFAEPVKNKTNWIPSLACYMFGGNDGVNFKLLAGREYEKRVGDLKFPYFPTQAYRYYLFVVCGEMSGNSRVTGIGIDISMAWHNRNR